MRAFGISFCATGTLLNLFAAWVNVQAGHLGNAALNLGVALVTVACIAALSLVARH